MSGLRRRALRRTGRLVLAYAGERLGAPASAGLSRIPRTPADIGPEWLTAALGAGERGARVVSVSQLDASSGTTTRGTLALGYEGHEGTEAGDRAGLPSRVFVKCTSTLPQRLMLGLGGYIDGEPGFYNHVRPGLEIESPVGYFAAVDPRSWRSIVLMEDVVSTRSARFWQPSETVTRAQAEDLLEDVAAWHGRLWDSPRLASWPWLRTPADHLRVIDALIRLADRTRAGARRARDVIPASLRARHDDLFEGMRRSLELTTRAPRTFLHGDLHIANTYVTGSGKVGVADWQTGLQGSWTFDVAYLLITALAIEDRRAWERELLDFYLERLREGGQRVPARTAWEGYRQATLYPYFAWTYTVGRSRLQPDFQPHEVGLSMLERICAAIEDLGSLRAVGL